MESRPEISEQIKREVRQKCFFGCVLCGNPVFQYDHLIEYNIVKEHTTDNIILLCPNHHNDKTTKKISIDTIKDGAASPFNQKYGVSGVHKMYPNKTMDVEIGELVLTISEDNKESFIPLIWINGYYFLSINRENDYYTISFSLTNIDGAIILLVSKGEMVVSTGVWDYKYEGSTLTVRSAKGAVELKLNLSNGSFLLEKGTFCYLNRDGFIIKDGCVFVSKRGRLTNSFTRFTICLGSRVCAFVFANRSLVKPGFFPTAGIRISS